MNVSAFGNAYSTVVIDLNEKVKALIANNDHKYDSLISKLQSIMENEEDVSLKQNSEVGPILKRKIKPLS